MMWGRKKPPAVTEAPEDSGPVEVEGARAQGPFDSSERPANSDEYVDLGSVRLKIRPDIEVQLPAENDVISAVLVTAEGSAIELRPFAGNRSGGAWDGVREELRTEVERRGGQWQEVEGAYGTELLARFPATAEDGSEAVQPARFIGIEGPRWVLRATVLGAAGLESTTEGVLMEVLRDTVIVRGDEPRMLRETLPLTIPPDAQPVADA